jgi:uncharacterized protein YjiS (DUF1127 family)
MMFDTLFERLKDWALVQEGIERLRQLDDRQLADMGIERDLIAKVAQTGVIVTHSTLADASEHRAAEAAAGHSSLARPPTLRRRAGDCGSVPAQA